MAGNTGIGYVNYFLTGTISAGSEESGLSATNLASNQCSPSTGWQTLNGIVEYSTDGLASLQVIPPGNLPVRAVGLFNTNMTTGASVTVQLYLASVLQAELTVSGPKRGYRQVIAVFAQTFTCDSVQIFIDDPANPDTHINVGGAFAGPLWLPESGISWDTTYGDTPGRTDVRTRGGQRYITPLYVERYWRLVLETVRDSEAWTDLGELRRVGGLGVNVLFIPNVSSDEMTREAVFGVVETQADISFPIRDTEVRSYRAQVTERL